jgi:phosphatidic acid-selective phospholipase A1
MQLYFCSAFIDYLIRNTGIAIASIHLMGHSAGAHIVGGAGALVTSGRITRITGKSFT